MVYKVRVRKWDDAKNAYGDERIYDTFDRHAEAYCAMNELQMLGYDARITKHSTKRASNA